MANFGGAGADTMMRSALLRLLCAAALVTTASAQQPARTRAVSPPPATRFDSVTQLTCDRPDKRGNVPVAGVVRPAAPAGTLPPIDSASVFLQWLNLTYDRRGVARELVTRTARAGGGSGGWYVICDVPASGTFLAWARRGGATTATLVLTSSTEPFRLDLTLDTTAARGTSVPAATDSQRTAGAGPRPPPPQTGPARYQALLRNSQGAPVANARARVMGHDFARSDSGGRVVLGALARGSQMLEIAAIGYGAERRIIDVLDGAPPDTIVLTSLNTFLDTVRVLGQNDPVGFNRRRSYGVGQFITADDVERENPRTTVSLLRTRKDMIYSTDMQGRVFLRMPVGPKGRYCEPRYLLDGFPMPAGVPAVAGTSTIDWDVLPEDIGGVELYTNPAQVPAQFVVDARSSPCGVVVFWTRERLGLPPSQRLINARNRP